jgi:inositol phosphorylceramide mannosyltransferase catalytic subunit
MRLRLTLCAIAVFIVLGFVVQRLLAFRQLFYEHAGIAITQDEIAEAHDKQTPDPRPQYIPKIIHNVYHNWNSDNDSVPSDWDGIRQNCMRLNPDFEFRVR